MQRVNTSRRNPKIFDASGKSKGIGRDNAGIGFEVTNKGIFSKILRIDEAIVDVCEHLELASNAKIVPIARKAIS